jgi:DNA excision repair protein ERCC-8
MNQLLFDRSAGTVRPQPFARAQITQQIHSFQPAPRLRFNGGEKEISSDNDDDEVGGGTRAQETTNIWAHQAGVNALALDIENRL